MNSIDLTKYNLRNAADRRAVLLQIAPDRAVVGSLHELLLDLFKREIEYRKGAREVEDYDEDDDDDYFEQIYWCGFLLYLVGDPSDVPLMWEAKHIDFDVGCMFDVQCFVGAGIDQTIQYLNEVGFVEIAKFIMELRVSGDFDDLPDWEQGQIEYYYSDEQE